MSYILTGNGERVTVIKDQTRDLGHGLQVKVVYKDGTEGWAHVENLLDENNNTFADNLKRKQ